MRFLEENRGINLHDLPKDLINLSKDLSKDS